MDGVDEGESHCLDAGEELGALRVVGDAAHRHHGVAHTLTKEAWQLFFGRAHDGDAIELCAAQRQIRIHDPANVEGGLQTSGVAEHASVPATTDHDRGCCGFHQSAPRLKRVSSDRIPDV